MLLRARTTAVPFALACLLAGCEAPVPSVPAAPVPDSTEAAGASAPSAPSRPPEIDMEVESRLSDLLDGRGPLHLSHDEMRLLVDSLRSGPYVGHYGVHGPDVSEAIDFNEDRRPDRFIFLAQSWGEQGAVYVQQAGGGYKLVGTLDAGGVGGLAVCPARGGAEVHVASAVGFEEDGALVNRAGGGYGQRLWVTSDTMVVREAFSVDPVEYLDEMSDAERAAAWRRLLRFVDRTAPRPGCITGAEFSG